MKMRTKKGFTLAELLIVIAIIAVLVAIAIPIFTSQLNSAKLAVDMANKRDLEAYGAMLLNTGELTIGDTTVILPKRSGSGGSGIGSAYYCFMEDGSLGVLSDGESIVESGFIIPEGAYRARGTQTEGADKHNAGDCLVLLISIGADDGEFTFCKALWWLPPTSRG